MWPWFLQQFLHFLHCGHNWFSVACMQWIQECLAFGPDFNTYMHSNFFTSALICQCISKLLNPLTSKNWPTSVLWLTSVFEYDQRPNSECFMTLDDLKRCYSKYLTQIELKSTEDYLFGCQASKLDSWEIEARSSFWPCMIPTLSISFNININSFPSSFAKGTMVD